MSANAEDLQATDTECRMTDEPLSLVLFSGTDDRLHTAARPHVVDARGSFCPGPLMELIQVIRESPVGEVIVVRSTDRGSRVDIPRWVKRAGHCLVGVEQLAGYDEITVQKLR